MGIKTKIEFADSTINPVMGCTGCELYHKDPDKNHCYAARLVNRHAGQKGWPKNFNEPAYFLERMEKALGWPDLTGKERENEPWLNGYPRIIFVNDLSDGFCPDVDPKVWLEPFMKNMRESPHVWLLLTKWPKQMAAFFDRYYRVPPNFWLGVSVTNQKTKWRIQDLLNIRSSVRLLSLEPVLNAIDLTGFLCSPFSHFRDHPVAISTLEAVRRPMPDWIVAGGESGPNARPMHPDWARLIRDQCQAVGVPLLFKQWGAWIPFGQGKGEEIPERAGVCWLDMRGQANPTYSAMMNNPSKLFRVGKEIAGRELDGVLWEEMPNVRF